MLELCANDRVLEFERLDIDIQTRGLTDLFGHKNNKSLGETLDHPRYRSLGRSLGAQYAPDLDRRLGSFLLRLKYGGDPTYRKFLNPYGDDVYCRFAMPRSDLGSKKGLYCYAISELIVYLGRSTDSFSKRINQGYGTIHPKNCYLDGQATNCHLNALFAAEQREVSLYVCALIDNDEIESLERKLIQNLLPEWNIALKRTTSIDAIMHATA